MINNFIQSKISNDNDLFFDTYEKYIDTLNKISQIPIDSFLHQFQPDNFPQPIKSFIYEDRSFKKCHTFLTPIKIFDLQNPILLEFETNENSHLYYLYGMFVSFGYPFSRM